ncbi:Cation/H+ exchanger [groundwater metagenome]|uniref:Cation/H+ exchanger n=1 Tax=groundwater metagenome TaxID=717931 RepID=A0A098EA98_9ZZZZ
MDINLISLAIIAIVLVTTVFILLRQSYIIGVIFAGICFAYFGIFQPDEIKFFSDIGILLLLFLIGMEFDMKKIGKNAFSIVIIALLKFLFIFMICYQLFLFLFSYEIAIMLASAFTFSSTAIVAKIAEERGILKEKEIQMMIGVLVIEDVIVIILMALISGTANIEFSIVKIFILILFSYFVLLKVIDKIFGFFAKRKAEENILLATIILCIVMAALTNFIGFSGLIGAFIAGNLVGSTRHSETIQKIFEPFTILFITLFFFSVGMMIHVEEVINSFAIIVLFVILNLFLKFYTVFFLYDSLEYNKEQAIRSSALMLSISEFSLVLLMDATNKGLIAGEILSAFGIAFIISAFISSLALKPEIFKKLHVLIPKSSLFDKFSLRIYKTKTGLEEEITKKVYAEGKGLWKDTIAILTVFAVSYTLSEVGHIREGIILLILSLPFTIHGIIKIINLIKEIFVIMHSFLIISKPTQTRIIGNIAVIIFLYLVFTTKISILSFFHLEYINPFLSVLFGIMMLWFIYDTIYIIANEKIINLKDINDYIENIIGIKKI